MHPADRPVLGEPALARAQVDLLPPVTALRPGDTLEDGRADPGPEAVHLSIIGAAENRFAAAPAPPKPGFTPWGAADAGARARLAEILAERDEETLAAYVDDELGVPYARLREELAAQTRRALVYPVFFGSAVTGAGVPELMAGLAELLPAGTGDASGPVSGRIFKVERGPGGERLAYVRMFSGTVRTRDRLRFSGGHEGKVTAIGVFERGTTTIRASVSAGQIAKLRGLDEIQIGDQIGEPGPRVIKPQFAPPTLASVVAARRPAERAALRVALGQLAEQDP